MLCFSMLYTTSPVIPQIFNSMQAQQVWQAGLKLGCKHDGLQVLGQKKSTQKAASSKVSKSYLGQYVPECNCSVQGCVAIKPL